MSDLELCPFCGGKPKMSGDYAVLCDCGASMSIYNIDDSNLVIERWNDRSVKALENGRLLKRINAKHPGAYQDMCCALWKVKHAEPGE